MNIQSIPESKEERLSVAKKLSFARTATGIAAVAIAIVAVLLVVGVVVATFLLEFGKGKESLALILIGSFTAGAILFALAAFALGKHNLTQEKRERDFLERCEGEECFFVGEGTLLSFGEEGISLFDAEHKRPPVSVPYARLRFFYVCNRRAAKEKGEWSLVIEIPAQYILKDKSGPPALVQTDLKPRLKEALEARGLPVIGEEPSEKKGKFEPLKKFYAADGKRQKTAIAVLAIGALLSLAALPVAFLLDPAAGAVLGVLGVFVLLRGGFAMRKARTMFGVYREGIFFRSYTDSYESAFLKWDEIERLEGSGGFLTAHCAYGDYRFPLVRSVWEYLSENFPEKTKEKG